MLSRRHPRALTTLLLTTGLVVAGCTGGAAPSATSAAGTSTSPSPTPSPTPTGPQPPERPAAMETADEAGALALAQYFVVDLYTYTFATGDVEAWTDLSDPDCGFCNSVVQNAKSMQEAGEEARNPPATVESATVATITAGAEYTATLQVLQTSPAPEPTDGSAPGEPTTQRYELTVAIAWQDGWRVRAVDARPIGG